MKLDLPEKDSSGDFSGEAIYELLVELYKESFLIVSLSLLLSLYALTL
tara:strand:- start:667 stop:810 length:144 start_codon:yes stop_codon:yes gene_type:complete